MLRTPGLRSTRTFGIIAGLVMALTASAAAVDTNTKLDGYRGIWFNLGQENEYGPKYSGGLGTYTANHVPISIYVEQQKKTFFVYGGTDDASGDLLIMASHYDHATCQVPRPTVVYHKVGINDPHDNGALLIDREGYLWVFISGRANSRVGFVYKSLAPYSTDAFQYVMDFDAKYPQPWYVDTGDGTPAFVYLFTRYTGGRELYWSRSTDGVNWTPGAKFVGFEGHYQTSCLWNGKIGTAFNHHPGGNVDKRTNLYYMETHDLCDTWRTVDGTPVAVPLTDKYNPALVVDYQAQGLLCYINDTNFDAQGRPYILYETSHNYAAGPGGDPRTWHLARWDGTQWVITDITTSDHNYDVGNLWVEGSLLRIIAPTENGPQVWGTGGEVALWTSTDLGATWNKIGDVTHGSVYNHSYVRRPVNGRDPFFAMWADGHAFQKSESRLYFCNRAGTHVWRLPQHMSGDFARPTRTTDFGASGGTTLWRSRFETVAAGPVAHTQPIAGVRNARGAMGLAAGASTLTYAAYGQPGVGAAPTAGAGTFAAMLPNDRSVAINANLASNAGNLQNALTFEGFFRTPETAPITAPTYVGRRLVTQKRGDSDESSRLAIGLHAGSVPGSDGLFDYEGFDYAGTVLQGQNGGLHWGGAWTNADTFAHLSNDGVSLNSSAFPFAPIGSRISGKGGTSARPLSRAIDLSSEGTVTYVSTLMRKTATPAGATAHNLEIGLATSATVAGTSSTVRIGMTSGHRFFLTNSNAPAGTVAANTPYFVLVKIISHASTADECFMHVYAPGQTVGTAEPSWLLTHALSSSATLTHLRMTFGANLDKGEIDEIRMGNTFASVTDPNAPIASGGGQANLLSVFWNDTDAANHLELGTTPVQPNTWYHFALTYDGTDIKWFLNGNLEGEVVAPSLTAAGSGTIGIGNNRVSGVSDRGFYGLLDEIRISDAALQPAGFLLNGGSCDVSCSGSGSVLWCSGFEAEPNVPVAHQQIESRLCGAIENLYGIGGTAIGVSELAYVAYDQPGVGAAPHAEAGAFAIALPDDRTVAIDTSLPSAAGNLDNAVTIEGFFNTAESAAIVSPDSIGRRLVTQRRDSATDTRLAVGLHANGGANRLAVLWKRSDGATHVAYGTTAIQANRWYHFAVVHDGTELRWYLDGSIQGTIADADLIAAGNASIVIGNRRADGVADRGFAGMIDDIRIFDRALSAGELLSGTGADDGPCYTGCNSPFADADADGDVDQEDFGMFQTCFSISGELLPDPACHCFDRAGDAYIDVIDLEEFMNCATGPAIAWDPGTTPSCIP